MATRPETEKPYPGEPVVKIGDEDRASIAALTERAALLRTMTNMVYALDAAMSSDRDLLIGKINASRQAAVEAIENAQALVSVKPSEALAHKYGPELLRGAQAGLLWLCAALECRTWCWDEDQREAAERSRETIRVAIAKATGEAL